MGTIYKYNHKKKTIFSSLFVLPATLLWIAAALFKFADNSLAQRFLELNLSMPNVLQFVVWVVLPLWALVSAVQAYRSGTVARYKKFNIFTIFLGVITILIFGITIVSTLI